MELTAAVVGLETLKRECIVTLVSDSEYLVKAISKGWAQSWKARHWRRKDAEIVPNWDLWNRLLDLAERHRVRVQWVEGHAGHFENERCDRRARLAAAAENLPADSGFENPTPP
jgi:ribonuclease HI